MFSARNAAWFVSALAAAGLTGCATTSTSLANSSERLERSALELQDEARDEDAGSDYRRDVEELAREARDFRRTLEERSSDDDDVQDAFRELSRRYHAVRDETERARDSELDSEFKDVTEAYLDIEREMGKVESRDRLARDD
jgi:hypothetical protein